MIRVYLLVDRMDCRLRFAAVEVQLRFGGTPALHRPQQSRGYNNISLQLISLRQYKRYHVRFQTVCARLTARNIFFHRCFHVPLHKISLKNKVCVPYLHA